MYKVFLFILFPLLLFTGCDDHKVVEELGFIHTIGYDRAESKEDDGQLHVTISFPIHGAEEERQTISSVADSSKEASIFLSRQTEKKLVSGQLRSVLIGEELAQEGFIDIMDTLKRDPRIGIRAKVSMVKGKANDLLTKKYPYYPELDNAIVTLLEKESKLNTIPDVSIYRFTRDYFDNGIDPVIPIITIGKGGMLSEGVALLRNDKYKTSLDPIKSRILFLLLGEFKMGDLPIKLEDEKTLFNFLSSKAKITVNVENLDNIHAFINVDFTGYLTEYIGTRDLSNTQEIFALEKEIATYLEEEAISIISIMQEEKIDNIGVGKYIRNKLTVENWETLNWPDSITTVDIQPRIKVKILDTGLIK
ncbi:Spore germination protein A3 precursor [Halalkalibacter krulwichiae]|uniref:Spore germination protein A3 n=2 Tax=Halalkalibacter krulwichiae TaxID=199441 RepID=A0A1X9MD11_9BACI|nr:Ger(x)C family spore germination protein [Halalkalibacter krulwichiae]ARK31308.1 Spore germination protein A3 precursor [Halalkalibacter krulwichiae]